VFAVGLNTCIKTTFILSSVCILQAVMYLYWVWPSVMLIHVYDGHELNPKIWYFDIYIMYSLFLCIFYPRNAILARVIAIATCLSVCLSVTRRYCVKTKKASGMVSSPSGSPKTLVFRSQISSPNSKGFPRTGATKKGRSEKFSDFFSFKRQYLENGSRYGQSYY